MKKTLTAACRRTYRAALACLVLVVMALPLGIAHAQSSSARIEFDIPAGDLASALNHFAEQSGFQIVSEQPLNMKRRVPALSGQYSPAEALAALLRDTDLEYAFVDGATAVIKRAESPSHASGSAEGAGMGNSGAARRGRAIEEIVVTAQKREQSLQDVPIAVSAIGGNQAIDMGIRTSSDLAMAVPGVSITRSTAATNIFLRGIGTPGGATGQDMAVATFVDGVYPASVATSTFSLNNIERIEVLKGPQGTLYGRNATAGAINIITKAPSHDPELVATLGYGNKDTVQGDIYATAPLSERVAVDVAAYYRNQRDGFGYQAPLDRDVNKSKDYNVRAKMLIDFTSDSSLTLAAGRAYTGGSLAVALRSAPSSSLLDGTQGQKGGYYDSFSEFPPFLETKSTTFSARFDHSMGDYQFVSLSAYNKADFFQRVDVDTTPTRYIDAPLYSQDEQFSQEFQVSYTGDRLNWILGAYYLDSTSKYNPFQIEGLGAYPLERLSIDSRQDTESLAFFAQGTYEFLPETNLTLGIRQTRDKRSLEAEQTGFLLGGGSIPLAPPVSKSENFSEPTWRIALDKRFSSSLMGYMSYSRGFKSGLYNLTAPDDPAVDPEMLDAYEIGIKAEMLDRSLRVNAALFHYDYDNMQVFLVRGASTLLLNAAKADVNGIEVELDAILTENLSLKAGLTWLDHEFTEFEGAPFTEPNHEPPFGNTVVPGNASGHPLTLVPDWTANVALDHYVSFGFGDFASNISVAYNDGFYWAPDLRVRQSAYTLVNAQVKWIAPGGTYNVSLWGNNIFATHYLASLQETGTGDNSAPAPGRTFGISIGISL